MNPGITNLFPKTIENVKAVTFSRHGGKSQPPFDSLNLSYDVGDNPEAVTENIKFIKKCLNATKIVHCGQIHEDRVISVSDNTADEFSFPDTDGLITDKVGLAIMIKHADCQAIVLYAPERRVIANLHCGWRGLVKKLPQTAIEILQTSYNCSPGSIMAAISPSLGPCCAEFNGWERLFPDNFKRYKLENNHFDLWEAARDALKSSGISEQNISVTSTCTACSSDYFSYRREKITGRCATIAMLT